MNKFITVTLCGTLLLSLTACSVSSLQEENAKDGGVKKESVSIRANEEIAQIPSPFIEYQTIQEAEETVGFNVMLPKNLPEGYTQNTIYVIENDLIEVNYLKDENEICFRQGKGDSDISGDYREYDEISTIMMDELEITTKGNNGKVNVATWTNGEHTFAISVKSLEDDMQKDIMIDMIKSIQ